MQDKILLDTAKHIPLLKSTDSQQLKYKCFDYGVCVDKDLLHRASSDVDYTKKLFFQYGFEKILYNKSRKEITCEAIISYHERHKAQAMSFRWNGDIKKWEKIIYEDELEDFRKTLNFEITY